MARTLQLQVLRGNFSSMPTLAAGEMYFGTDTGNLYFGLPGVGRGYITIGDTTVVNETLQQILMEMKAMRMALTVLACSGGGAHPDDFNPNRAADDHNDYTLNS